MAHDALALGVLVEPTLQARPCPSERLVGEFVRVLFRSDESRPHQQRDDTIAIGVAEDVSHRHATADRRTVDRRRHHAQEQ